MKQIIRKLIPQSLLYWYQRRNSKFKNKTPNSVFTKIYKDDLWNSAESSSGTGSELEQTKSLRNDLEKLFNELNITSILDLPCGDFKWMQEVDLSKINYTGADIVAELIDKNKTQFVEHDNLRFVVLNLIEEPLPKCDLIMVRDCLVHFSYADVFKAIKNIKSSGCTYLLTTTFTDQKTNHDIVTGDWRAINLQEKPFSFPSPLKIINENCTENHGAFKDKSMALWKLSEL